MKSLRHIGLYLITIFAVLLMWSIWQIKHGSESANLSFVVAVPFAIGLLCERRWAIWGTGFLGILSSSLMVGIAMVHSISGLTGLSVELGPFQMSHPNAVAIWIFTLVYLLVIGVPMASVLTLRKNRRQDF